MKKILLGILFLAFVLRIYDISNNPKAMYGDSLTLVYDAYSILKTGHDSTGELMPLFFATGGGRPAGYIYATIPFVAIFGPSALAARAVSVLSGMGIVLLLYLICSQILSKKIGLFAAFFATISSWELSLSRGEFESHFALFLSLLGWYFFIKAKENIWFLLASGLVLGLAMQTYSTFALLIPLFAMLLLFSSRNSLNSKLSKFRLIFLVIIILSLGFSLYISVSRGSNDRFSNLLIFRQPELQNSISIKLSEERAYSSLSPELIKKVHNRIWENIGSLFENYTRSYGIEFLFLKGDLSPRHNPANLGQLYWGYLPLIILGLIYLYQKNKKLLQFLLLWIAFAPAATSLVGPPHALRSSFLLPPLLILAAVGTQKVWRFKYLLILVILIQFIAFAERFYFLAPNLNAKFWSYSAKNAVERALEKKTEFDYVIISTSIPDIEYAYPVYTKVAPLEFRFQDSHKTKLDEYTFSKYDNVYLGSIPTGAVRKVIANLPGSVYYMGPIEDQGKIDGEGIQRDEAHQPLYVISIKE